MELEGRVAVITAATRSIGRAVAETFVDNGATVVLNGRSEEKGKQALAEMGVGDRARFIAGDARRKDDVEALIAGAVEAYGRLDILVNNAGGSAGFGLVAELSDEAWQGTLDWCLNSTFWATRAALPHMVANKWGRIINMSSVEGKQANKAAISPYIVNKHAINGFTKAVAFEYGPMGITSNAICPGAVETDMMRDMGPAAAESTGMTYEQFLEAYANESMIKRLNRVEEVAAMALLLASENGGGITGSLLNVDGGTASW